MFCNFKKEKQPDTLKTVLAVIGAIIAVAGIVVAVQAIIKTINKKLSACKADDGTDDCLCDDCCCEQDFCGEPCTVNDPVTVVSEGREVTDETESGESI
ncbi:MAG: hypothetical protein IJN63_09210 [Clostridia bacterium]|nr:hypothetical protein [Clostridia bacterium]